MYIIDKPADFATKTQTLVQIKPVERPPYYRPTYIVNLKKRLKNIGQAAIIKNQKYQNFDLKKNFHVENSVLAALS